MHAAAAADGDELISVRVHWSDGLITSIDKGGTKQGI